MEIFSDASLTGWGAYCNGVKTRGSWTDLDRSKHVNELELLSAFYSIQAFAPRATDISIHNFMDNTTAVSFLNKCSVTKSTTLLSVALKISKWCGGRNICVEAVYLAGSANVIADQETRA